MATRRNTYVPDILRQRRADNEINSAYADMGMLNSTMRGSALAANRMANRRMQYEEMENTRRFNAQQAARWWEMRQAAALQKYSMAADPMKANIRYPHLPTSARYYQYDPGYLPNYYTTGDGSNKKNKPGGKDEFDYESSSKLNLGKTMAQASLEAQVADNAAMRALQKQQFGLDKRRLELQEKEMEAARRAEKEKGYDEEWIAINSIADSYREAVIDPKTGQPTGEYRMNEYPTAIMNLIKSAYGKDIEALAQSGHPRATALYAKLYPATGAKRINIYNQGLMSSQPISWEDAGKLAYAEYVRGTTTQDTRTEADKLNTRQRFLLYNLSPETYNRLYPKMGLSGVASDLYTGVAGGLGQLGSILWSGRGVNLPSTFQSEIAKDKQTGSPLLFGARTTGNPQNPKWYK